MEAGKGNIFWQKVVIKPFTKQRPKGGKKTVEWGRGGQKFLPLQRSSFHSLKLPHSDGNMAELCASAAILAKSPTSAYTHLQGVAELTEFGNREKGIIYRL